MPRYEPTNDRLGILHGITLDSAAPPPPTRPTRPRKKREHSSPSPSTTAPPEPTSDAPPRPKSKRFRFKKPARRTSPRPPPPRPKQTYAAPLADDPTAYDDTYIPHTASWQHAADPNAAFRESLFDAMADDEGAAFWEGVYGQPIHGYARPEVRDERGELERMTDDEYAEYVRGKMWERSHQHIVEERERREREREARRERERERERREERRRERRRREVRRDGGADAGERWEAYTKEWEAQMRKGDRERIPWPVVSGRREDVRREEVERFLAASGKRGGEWRELVRRERVRWHPDKAMQRWGREGEAGLEEEVLRKVTVVFQTVDEVWNREKERE